MQIWRRAGFNGSGGSNAAWTGGNRNAAHRETKPESAQSAKVVNYSGMGKLILKYKGKRAWLMMESRKGQAIRVAVIRDGRKRWNRSHAIAAGGWGADGSLGGG